MESSSQSEAPSGVNSPSTLTKVLATSGGLVLGFAAALVSSSETVINFAQDLERAGQIGARIEDLVGSGTFAGYSAAAAITGIVLAAYLKSQWRAAQ